MTRVVSILIVSVVALVVVLAAVLPSTISYKIGLQEASPLTGPVSSEVMERLPNEWRERLKQWIRLAYVENEDWAAFSGIGPEWFIPNLGTTYCAVGILLNLGQTVPNRESIVGWINSLRTEEGGYSNPPTPQHFSPPPTFFCTYWAVSTLNMLQASLDQQAVLNFLKHQQDENGLFIFSDLPTSPTDYIVPAYFAIEILGLSDIPREQWTQCFDPRVLQNYLLSYIEDQLSTDPPTLIDDNASSLIAALQTLAKLDFSLVPENGKTWLKEKLSEIPSLPPGLPSVILVNDLLEACGLLKIEVGEEKEDLQSYLREKIFPQQCPSGGFGYSESYTMLEPMFTFQVVKLTNKLRLSYPRSNQLLSVLGVRYLEGGYIPFVHANTAPDFSFYALSLAHSLGITEEFNSQKLLCYLEVFLEEGKGPEGGTYSSLGPLYQLYHALHAYCLLTGEISPDLRTKVTQTAQKLTEESSSLEENSYFTLRDVSFLSLLAKDLAIDLDEVSLLKISESLDIIAEYITETEKGIILLDSLYNLESALYREGEIPSREVIIAEVLGLGSEEGAFKALASAPIPDLLSTYLGLKLLENLGASAEIDWKKTEDFVLSCLCEFGFNYAPESLIAEAPNTYLVSDSRSTYQGLKLLEYLASKGQ
jgi:hypothetical protein